MSDDCPGCEERTGFARNEEGMVTGGPWPARAGEATVDMAEHSDGEDHT